MRASRGKSPHFLAESLERRCLLSANLITNGSFEMPVVSVTGMLNIGDNSINPLVGWTTMGVAILGNSYSYGPFTINGTTYGPFTFNAADGAASLNLGRSSVGQSITTVVGSSYNVTFSVGNVVDLSGNAFGTDSFVQLWINGKEADVAGNSAGGNTVNWKQFTFPFTATTTSTFVQFVSFDSGHDGYTGLDAVSVTAIVQKAQTAQIAFIQPPSDTAAGDTIAPPVSVAVEDSSGNFLTDSTDFVTIALAPSADTGTLTGALTQQAVNGIATFSNLSIDAGGDYNLIASDGSVTPVTSSPFKITGDKLVYQPEPVDGTANDPLKPIVVQLQDGQGNVETTDNSTVITLTPIGFTSANPIKNNTATVVNGIATFSNVILTKPGFYQLQATDAAGDAQATSDKFKVVGDHLVIKPQPKDADSNSPIPFIVEIENEKNQPDLNATSFAVVLLNPVTGGAGAVLSGTTSAQFVRGFARFTPVAGPKVDVPGTYNFDVTEEELSTGVLTPTNTSTDATTGNFNIKGAHLAFKPQPGSGDVNSALPMVVSFENSKNVVDRTQNGAGVLLTLTPVLPGSTAVLSGVITANFVNGMARFTTGAGPMINLAGDYTLSASDPASPSVVPAVSKPFAIAGLKVIFKKQVIAANISAPIVMTVELVDAKNKPFVNENTATVQLTEMPLADGLNATLSGTVVQTFTGGIAQFTVTAGPELDTVGLYQFTATETGTGFGGTSTDLTAPGQSKPVKVTGNFLKFLPPPPTSANINDVFPLTVEIVTKTGARILSQNTNLIQLTLNTLSGGTNAVLGISGGGSLSQQCAFGQVQFNNLFINSPGTYTITATEFDPTRAEASNETVPLDTKQIKVEGLHVEVLDQPGDVLPYQSIGMKFALEDSNHKIDTAAVGYSMSLGLETLNGGAGAGLLSGGASTDFVNGIAEYSAASGGAGNGVDGIDNHPGTFDFNANASSVITGAAPVTPAKTHPFKVLPLHLEILEQPSDVPAFAALPFQVALEGPNKKPDTFANETSLGMSLNASSGTGRIIATGGAHFVGGVANFDPGNSGTKLAVSGPGTYSLTFNEVDNSGAPIGTTPALTSSPFKITPISLAITQQPANLAVGASIALTAALEDPNNTFVAGIGTFNATVQLQIISGGTNAQLTGGLLGGIVINGGSTSFSQFPIAINAPGTYQLVVQFQSVLDGSIVFSATTNMFTVT